MKRLKEVQAELQLVRERESLLPTRLDEYLTLTEAEEGRVLRDRNELEDEGKVKQQKLAKINEAVGAYGERLGLRISRTDGEDLAFVFTQIDERTPHEEFSVLGFLGVATYFAVQLQVLHSLSEIVYGERSHLVHLFEKVCAQCRMMHK